MNIVTKIRVNLCLLSYSWLTRTVLIRLQIKVRPKGLHSFAFYISNFKFSSCLSVFVAKTPRNLRLEVFDNCREFSTNRPFYAKQTQFPKSQMNVNRYNTMDYENISDWTIGQNKPNSNPIKPCPERSRMGQSPKSSNERKLNFNKGLQKKR